MTNGNHTVRDNKKCKNPKCNKPVEKKLYYKNCWDMLIQTKTDVQTNFWNQTK